MSESVLAADNVKQEVVDVSQQATWSAGYVASVALYCLELQILLASVIKDTVVEEIIDATSHPMDFLKANKLIIALSLVAWGIPRPGEEITIIMLSAIFGAFLGVWCFKHSPFFWSHERNKEFVASNQKFYTKGKELGLRSVDGTEDVAEVGDQEESVAGQSVVRDLTARRRRRYV